MAGVGKTFKKITSSDTLKKRLFPNPTKAKEVEKGFGNPFEVLSEGAEDITSAFTPEIPVPEEETIIPLPDPNIAKTRARKRRAAAKGSGRQSTILTEGLGG